MLNMIQRRTEHLRARNAWRWGAVRIKKLSLRPGVVFVREWARSPRLAGAVCPSGTALAKAMADRVPAGLRIPATGPPNSKQIRYSDSGFYPSHRRRRLIRRRRSS